MTVPALLPDPTCLHLRLLDASDTLITAVVGTTSTDALCPLCQHLSERIHSRYVRVLADLPWMGCAVRLELNMRRFFCINQECARQIFTERLPTMVAPYARRTTRLTDVFTLIGFALGGEAGQRLVKGLGLSASPDTLLRLIRTQPEGWGAWSDSATTAHKRSPSIRSFSRMMLLRPYTMLHARSKKSLRTSCGPAGLPGADSQ